jgi:signal transduction histidine kinase/HAMP domain-containing protein
MEQPEATQFPPLPRARVRIGTALNVYSVLLAVLPVLIVVLIATTLFGQQARDQAVDQMAAIADARAQEIQRWLENGQIRLNVVLANNEQVRDMRTIVDNPLPNPRLNDTVRVFLESQLAVQASFDELFLYDLRGNVRLSTAGDGLTSDNISELPYFEPSIEAAHIEPPYINPQTGEIEIIVSGPIFRTDEAEDIIGVMAGRLSLAELGGIMTTETGLGDTGETYLVNSNGLLITPTRSGDVALGEAVESAGISAGLAEASNSEFYDDYSGQRVIGVYRWLPELQSALLAEIDEAEALSAVNDVQRASFIIAAIGVLAAFGIGRLVTRWLVQPVRRLTRVSRAVMGGDYSQRAELKVVTEIGQLGRAFDTMTDNLVKTLDERNARIKEIEQLSASLENRVADRTRDLRVAADVSKQITTVLDIDALLKEVVKRTVEGFSLARCYVFRMDEQSNALTLSAGSRIGADGEGEIIDEVRALRLDDSSPAGLAATRQEAVIVTKNSDPKFFDPDKNIGSIMAIPMILGSSLVGVFAVHAESVDRFKSEDRGVFNTLAENAAIAMRNAELYADAQDARAEAEEANRVKSQFLANMSHELRTPLNAILNFAEFMADGDMGDVNEEQEEALNKVINSGEHLLSLINDVLDITKIEVGMLELFLEDVDLNKALKAVLSTGKGLVKDRPIDLVTEVEPDLPSIKGDRRRLHQVFLNLISNAVKFTPQGEVRFTASSNGNEVLITVKDTGVGIAPEELDLVFESFRQSESGRKSSGGTGLGLPISKHFVEAHGGRLWLESKVNEGTTFYVALPKEAPEPDKQTENS